MKLPFTTDAFFEVFRAYHEAVFPMQYFFYMVVLALIYLCIRKPLHSNQYISIMLAFLGLWMGIVYHLSFFAEINKAASLFGVFFVLQGLIFVYFGFVSQNIFFTIRPDFYGFTGGLFFLYALILYPAIGYSQGHVYPSAPSFGLPCPTTIFTFGLFLWTKHKFPLVLIVIPTAWAIIGTSAAIYLNVFEDIGLAVAAVTTNMMLFIRNRRAKMNLEGAS